jgi:hypothetical protein
MAGSVFERLSFTRLSSSTDARRLKPRPDIGAAVAASPAGKLRIEIRQPDIIGQRLASITTGMRTVIIAAEHDEPGRAGPAHFSDRDFLSPWHGFADPRLERRGRHKVG